MLEETEGKITVELSFTLIFVTFTENLQKTSNSTLAIKNNKKQRASCFKILNASYTKKFKTTSVLTKG